MKKLLIPVMAVILAATACNKANDTTCDPETTQAPATEVTALRSYIAGDSITATEDPRGFFYNITDSGSARKPRSCSKVYVNYAGRLTNGTLFDSNDAVSFSLKSVIKGWTEGVPLIGEGGKITLYLPPSLAYGSAASGPIPANSILIFDIQLTRVD